MKKILHEVGGDLRVILEGGQFECSFSLKSTSFSRSYKTIFLILDFLILFIFLFSTTHVNLTNPRETSEDIHGKRKQLSGSPECYDVYASAKLIARQYIYIMHECVARTGLHFQFSNKPRSSHCKHTDDVSSKPANSLQYTNEL